MSTLTYFLLDLTLLFLHRYDINPQVLDTISMDDRSAKMRKFDCLAACRDREWECGGVTLSSLADDTNCYLSSWSTIWDNSTLTEDSDYISYIMVLGDDFAYTNINDNMTNIRVGEFGFMNPVPPMKPPHPPGPWPGTYWAGLSK